MVFITFSQDSWAWLAILKSETADSKSRPADLFLVCLLHYTRTFLLNAEQPPLPNPPSPGLVGGGVVEASHHPGPVHQQAYSVNTAREHQTAALYCKPPSSVSDFYLLKCISAQKHVYYLARGEL